MRLGPALDAALAESVRAWAGSGMVRRLWAKDACVWTGGDEAAWLGWLDVATAEAPLEALGLARCRGSRLIVSEAALGATRISDLSTRVGVWRETRRPRP